jgi:DNA-binding transcriptional MocR family regulator
MSNPDYLGIADRLSADIASGRMRPGERLKPQRIFAYEAGIAVSTASRVYAELIRRGLVTGEVGRGTYVRSGPPPLTTPLIEPTSAPVDLELIFPVLPEHAALLARSLQDLAASPFFADALKPIGAAGTPAARQAAARFLARAGWCPAADGILFSGNGRQAIAAAFSALAKPGDRIAVEALTYPVAKGVAQRLGITLVPIDLDGEGMLPDALAAAHAKASLAAVYLQPSLHSPTGATMSAQRRQAIAHVLSDADIPAIEDAVYAFLVDDPPLAGFAADRVILIDSLSKRIAPGLTLGLLAAPEKFVGRISAALRSGAWSPSGLPLAAGVAWMNDAATGDIVAAKRADAQSRQALAREALAPYPGLGDLRAYHLWLPLPEPWRAEAFAAEALKQGIALTPGSAFAVVPGHAPNGVRLALAAPAPADLIDALQRLRRLIGAGPLADVE